MPKVSPVGGDLAALSSPAEEGDGIVSTPGQPEETVTGIAGPVTLPKGSDRPNAVSYAGRLARGVSIILGDAQVMDLAKKLKDSNVAIAQSAAASLLYISQDAPQRMTALVIHLVLKGLDKSDIACNCFRILNNVIRNDPSKISSRLIGVLAGKIEGQEENGWLLRSYIETIEYVAKVAPHRVTDKVVDVLLSRLLSFDHDDQYIEYVWALESIAHYAPDRITRSVVMVLDQAMQNAYLNDVADYVKAFRSIALNSNKEPIACQAVWVLAKHLKSQSIILARECALGLEMISRKASPAVADKAVAALVTGLKHPSGSVVLICVGLLSSVVEGKSEYITSDFVNEMIGLLNHPDAAVAREAAIILGFISRVKPDLIDLNTLWPLLGLRSIEFKDAGNGISTTPWFMEKYLARIPPPDEALVLGAVEMVKGLEQPPVDAEPLPANGAYNRSVKYPLRDGRLLVFKKANEGQSEAQLVREVLWLDLVKKKVSGLRSTLPEPILDEAGRPVVYDIDGVSAIAFKASSNYYRYLDDPSLTDEEFLKGLKNSVHDMVLLARYGIYHRTPLTLFHDQTGTSPRLFVLSPGVAFNSKGELGDLDNWPEALAHGNMGVDGMRDLEELVTLEELMQPGSPYAKQLQELKMKPNAAVLMDALLMANVYFAASLYIGNRIRIAAESYAQSEAYIEGVPFWQNDKWLQKYADWLLDTHAEGYSARWNLSLDAAREVIRVRADWLRLARQLAFFMTNAYVPYVTDSPDRLPFPTDLIYGPDVKVSAFGPYNRHVKGTFHPTYGWISRDGDLTKLGIGSDGGRFTITEAEKAFWSMAVAPPHYQWSEQSGDEKQTGKAPVTHEGTITCQPLASSPQGGFLGELVSMAFEQGYEILGQSLPELVKVSESLKTYVNSPDDSVFYGGLKEHGRKDLAAALEQSRICLMPEQQGLLLAAVVLGDRSLIDSLIKSYGISIPAPIKPSTSTTSAEAISTIVPAIVSSNFSLSL